MQAAVLMYQRLTRRGDDFALRETSGQSLQRDVIVSVVIDRNHYGIIDNQEVGVIGG